MISRLSLQFRDSRQWRIRWREAVGRCRQICIWLHRAGRARSQEREMKFDRSDPLALGFSFRSPSPPCSVVSFFSSQPRELQNGVGACPPWVPAPSSVPHGIDRQLQTPLSLTRNVVPPLSFFFCSLSLSLSRGAPHFIRFSFICYFPVAAATAAGYAPPGHPLERAGLLSSNPTPFYKYITRPSGPLPLLTPDPLPSSYRCPIVTLRCAGGGAWWVPPFA